MTDLGLQKEVQRDFDFLTTAGYKCVESTPYRVRFESPTVFVEVVFDGNRSYELGLLIGTIGSENPPFSIDEILRLRSAPEAHMLSLVQVTTREALATWVLKLADLLRTYGKDFIAGNKKCFDELALHRMKETQTYALDRDLRMARAEAETAWHKKDYQTVVKVLKPFRDALTASEAGKLEFAEKQIDQYHD